MRAQDFFRVNATNIGELWALKFSADPGYRDYYALGQMITDFVNAKSPQLIDHGSSYCEFAQHSLASILCVWSSLRCRLNSACADASKSFQDGQGRRVIWAWVREEMECPKTRRCSLQSLPRVVTAETMRVGPHDRQQLKFTPLPELSRLRDTASAFHKAGLTLEQGRLFTLPLRSPHAELAVTVRRSELARCSGFGALHLLVLRSEDGAEQTSIRLGNLTNGSSSLHGRPGSVSVSIDRSKSTRHTGVNADPPPKLAASCWLAADAAEEPTLAISIFVDATIM